VPCWRVEREGEMVYVRDKISRPWAQKQAGESRSNVRSVIILGAGAAGESAAETLRREGYEGQLTLFDSDPDAPYDRPNLSKDYLAGSAPEEWIPLHPAEFYAERGIEIIRDRRVTGLEPGRHRIRLDNGDTRQYDALLLATGASPVRLPESVDPTGRIHYLRTLGDSRRIISGSAAARTVVVLGASFIGLEVAASLRARKLEVHVVAPEPRPLERVMGPQLGDFIRRLHEEHGVVFHLSQRVQAVGTDSVRLESGEKLQADLVVAGIGVRPNVELAERAGLQLDRGVQVDELLRTSAPDVFAAGDIARWPDRRSGERIRVEHWVVAQRQGQTAALNILGQEKQFEAVPFFWSQHYDVPINYVGHAESWDRIEVEGDIDSRDCAVRYLRGDRLLAMASIYRDRENLEAEVRLEELSVSV
jgi:apoptosis-inducing factor 3